MPLRATPKTGEDYLSLRSRELQRGKGFDTLASWAGQPAQLDPMVWGDPDQRQLRPHRRSLHEKQKGALFRGHPG